jgi:hypothetical protein
LNTVIRPKGFLRFTAAVDDIEPIRRRGYLKRLYESKRYRNASRMIKVAMRRIALEIEVPRD